MKKVEFSESTRLMCFLMGWGYLDYTTRFNKGLTEQYIAVIIALLGLGIFMTKPKNKFN